MSDTQQGPDWWLASDGKWYPPTSTPASTPALPPPPNSGVPSAPYLPYQQFAAPQTSGKATAILVLGIVSLVLMCAYGLGLIPAIVALAMAPGAKREIAASGGRIQGDGQVKAGVVCSWVTVGIVAVSIVAVVIIAIVAAGSNSSGY